MTNDPRSLHVVPSAQLYVCKGDLEILFTKTRALVFKFWNVKLGGGEGLTILIFLREVLRKRESVFFCYLHNVQIVGDTKTGERFQIQEQDNCLYKEKGRYENIAKLELVSVVHGWDGRFGSLRIPLRNAE